MSLSQRFGWCVTAKVWKWAPEGSWSRETFLGHCCCVARAVGRAEHRDLPKLQEVTHHCGSEMRKRTSSPGYIWPGEGWKQKDVNIKSI